MTHFSPQSVWVAGLQAATLCDGRVFSTPDKRTILVHEIKSKRQEKHDGKHFMNLLTNPEDTERHRVASPVAQAYGYAVSPLCHTSLVC